MPSEHSIVEQVHGAVRIALEDRARVVLAVSGGLDSMVMLDAATVVAPERIAAVASFDHGTGTHARRAVALVRREARRRGLAVRTARARGTPRGEAEWRDARWAFLRSMCRAYRAPVATAHTDDDHLETVAMRILRGAGARGIAGLYARTEIVRPLLGSTRAELEAYARVRDVRWVVDPSNDSTAYFRNRLRHELLPALRAADHSFDEFLRSISARAAAWRDELDLTLGTLSVRTTRTGSLRVAAAALQGYDRESLRVLWPALAARAGARLDRRGTSRLAEFTMTCAGRSAPVSGGWEVVRTRDELILRRQPDSDHEPRALNGAVAVGPFRFRPVSEAGDGWIDDPWRAALPAGERIVVRPWRAGDRMRAAGAGAPRRVKRFLSDAGIMGPERIGWPVIEAAGEVVWIPGVRRSDAATARSGRPVVVYLCERLDR